MSTPQPGWYPDPDDETRARYWDGQGWTDRTRERSATGAEPGEQDSPTNSGRPFWRKPAAAVALAVALVVAVGAFVLLSSSQAGAEVILEPTASTGTDPFTESVANKSVLELTSSPQTELAGEPVEGFAGNGAQTESLSGATPGLYGGTGKEAVCDPQALVGFLEHNPDKARAFAAVFGIKPKGIADYVSGLTPLLLREDTRVTNHGFSDGVANPFDAVLQAGTAVLVDDRGVPRVRCACGNPLSEPTAIETAPSYSGDSWQSFDENRVLAVAPANQQIDSFEVVDVETGKSYEEAAGSGDVRDLIFDFGGVGNLRIGMTEKEAREATGLDISFTPSGNGDCATVEIPGVSESANLAGLSFDGKTLGAISAGAYTGSSPVATRQGVAVGDSEQAVRDVYPDAKHFKNEYTQIGDLIVENGSGDVLRFILGDADHRVGAILTGRDPEVFNAEGCS